MARSDTGNILTYAILAFVGYYVWTNWGTISARFTPAFTNKPVLPIANLPPNTQVQPAPGSTATHLAPGSVVTIDGGTSIVNNDGSLTEPS